ncbi:hypothetical protein [Streptomyces sp. NPDC058268]|uniref:hypothetical protein n=1 Tax=Streptomyces sp. NPDC058268 TaxID=3346413 RepID=UPI0036EE0B0E
MTEQTTPGTVPLDRQQAENLIKLLRQVEQFLDECDESVEEALATHFDLHPASEAFSAALCFHADTLETALAEDPGTSRTSTRRITAVQSPPEHIESR